MLYGGSKISVLVVSGGTVQSREVRTGLGDDEDIEIREGLAEGEAVVMRAGSFLRDGDQVRAIPTKRTATAAATSSRQHRRALKPVGPIESPSS